MDKQQILKALQAREISLEEAKHLLQSKTRQDNGHKTDTAKVSDTRTESSEGGPEEVPPAQVVEIKDLGEGVVQITMQDEENKNMFTPAIIQELTTSFEQIQSSEKYKVAILTGQGNYFASGGTPDTLIAIQQGEVEFTDAEVFSLPLYCDIPVIAAMQGHAMGAGWALGMFSDFIVMSKESLYTSNYMTYGFTPGAGATLVFPEKLGVSLAQEILFTGDAYSGLQLREKGVPFTILPRDEVLAQAIKTARSLSKSPRAALIALKKRMAGHLLKEYAQATAEELAMHEDTFVNNDEVKQRIEDSFGNLATPKGKGERKQLAVRKDTVTTKFSAKNNHRSENDPIAIIGASGQFPASPDLASFWENLKAGNNCVSEVPLHRWDMNEHYDKSGTAPGKAYSKWGGFIDDIDKFDPLFFNISPAEAEMMDPQQRLFLTHCWRCIEDAGISPASLSGHRCGVYVGCGQGDYSIEASDGNAQSFMGMSNAILSARISYLLNLKGPNMAIDTACSSSLVAISEACNSLILNNSDIAIAGGVYLMNTPSMHIMTSQAGMLSKNGKCFTFDQRANGFVPGEGVGVIVLKKLSKAVEDNDRIYGVIRGWGVNQDGKTNGITAPSTHSQSQLEAEVYRRFKIDPEDITLVEAHGTGTKLGDPIEVEALTDSFAQFTKKKNYCALGSVKSNIGHSLTAAGISGVLKVLLSLEHKMLPPTINFNKVNEHIDIENSPFYINSTLQPWKKVGNKPRLASVSSFGFSGTNAHLVIEEYNEGKEHLRVSADMPALITLSARTKDQLRTYATNIREFVTASPEEVGLHDIAYTLQVGRNVMKHRVAFVTCTKEDMVTTLESYIDGLENKGIHQSSPPPEEEGEEYLLDETKLKWRTVDELSQIAEAWTKGLKLPAQGLYHKRTLPKRLSLPTYPFAEKSYWYTPSVELSHKEEKVPMVSPSVTTASEASTQLMDLTTTEGMDKYVANKLLQHFSMTIKEPISEIDTETSFADYGLDSILGTAYIKGVGKMLKIDLNAAILFDYTTLSQLKKYIIDTYQSDILIEASIAENTENITTEEKSESTVRARVNEGLLHSLSKILKLRLEEIEESIPFSDYGVDSTLGTSLIKEINATLNIDLNVAILFDYSTINQLEEYILSTYRGHNLASTAKEEPIEEADDSNHNLEILSSQFEAGNISTDALIDQLIENL